MTPSSRREPKPDPHLPFEELAVGHALSALEPEEEERFAAHLASCARCERAVAEHTETLAQLAHGAPPVAPPPGLLEGIRAGMRDDRPDMAARPAANPPQAARDDLGERRVRRSVQVRRSHLLTSAAAVVVLLLGLGGWNAALHRDNAEQGARVESLAAAVQALEEEGTRTVRLASPEGQVLAVAVLQGEEMSLVLDGLEPNEDDTVYVLWGQSRYGDVRAVGTFDVKSRELEVLHGLRLEPGVGEVTTLMVTHEQGRTPPAMTTQEVLVSGQVQQT
jgi:anti-sigma factor RsiW